jgi:hypothetical protein
MPDVVGQYTVFGISTANFLQVEWSGNQTGVGLIYGGLFFKSKFMLRRSVFQLGPGTIPS